MTSFGGEDGRWIRRFHQSPESDVRLVCFPHAGGAASYYFPLSRSLAPHVEALAVQYPGRQDRRTEPCVENVVELATRIHEALKPWTGRPFAFFGHSMGAIVAFEVARRLREHGETGPMWLFASGRRAPSRSRADNVHLRNDAGVVAELRRMGSTDPRVLDDDELLATILPATRSDYRAIETYSYTPGPSLECPVDALVGDSDPQTTIAEAAAWGEHSTGKFELRVFSGGHFYLDAHRSAVVDAICTALAGAAHRTIYNGGK
jgi:pyochelin biosynthetic protein PchC